MAEGARNRGLWNRRSRALAEADPIECVKRETLDRDDVIHSPAG